MKKVIYLVVPIWVLLTSVTFASNCYEATGFGDSTYNGIYEYYGQVNGVDAFKYNSNRYLYYSGAPTYYYLGINDTGSAGYYNTESSYTPIAWVVNSGTPPDGATSLVTCPAPPTPPVASTTEVSQPAFYTPFYDYASSTCTEISTTTHSYQCYATSTARYVHYDDWILLSSIGLFFLAFIPISAFMGLFTKRR